MLLERWFTKLDGLWVDCMYRMSKVVWLIQDGFSFNLID